MTSIFPNTKPFLTESTLEELEFTEGYCRVEQRAARRSYINVGFLKDLTFHCVSNTTKAKSKEKLTVNILKFGTGGKWFIKFNSATMTKFF